MNIKVKKYIEEKTDTEYPFREWTPYSFYTFESFAERTDYAKITFHSSLPEVEIELWSIDEGFLYKFSIYE